MKRFIAKIGRFFWSWGFLKFILWTVTLIVFLYVEEDWRGARAWAATKAKWEAKGETFDYKKFIPPPVPDDQNLAALPLFKLEMVKDTYDDRSDLEPVALEKAMRSDFPTPLDTPPMGKWQQGELPDMAKFRSVIATNYATVFKGTKPPDDTLAQFDAIYPFLTDLRAAAVTRPFFRLEMDYAASPPAVRSFGPLTRQIKLSQLLSQHAILALDHHQPDLALEDIKLNYQLLSGVKRDPTLVGGLVAIGMAAIHNPVLYDGLARHSWNDAQLIELDQTLKPINFLADYQFEMRCEVAEFTAQLDFLQHARRSGVKRVFGTSASDMPLTKMLDVPWPSGWWDQNKSREAAFVFRALTIVEPQSRRVFPDVSRQIERETEQTETLPWRLAPWNLFFFISAPTFTNLSEKFAAAQTLLDEARIACALERYRLAQGVYPGSLEALAPAYIDELPHDIMNSEPYHYRLRPDGTYLLYSVGWDQKDDGGKVVYKKDAPRQVDYEQGDWVWPTPK